MSPNAGQVVAEYSANADPSTTAPLRKYVYASYIDEPVLLIDATSVGSQAAGVEEFFYYHQNNLYSVAALSDTTGAVLERYAYDPYGKLAVLDADFTADADNVSDYGNRYVFTGRRLDGETGLYFYRARYYHAELGTFVSRDPIGYGAGDQHGYRSGNSRTPFGYKGELGYYANPASDDLYVRARVYQPVTGRWLSIDPLGHSDDSYFYRPRRHHAGLRGFIGRDPLVYDVGLMARALASPVVRVSHARTKNQYKHIESMLAALMDDFPSFSASEADWARNSECLHGALNLYCYVGGNPTTGTDPSGKLCRPCSCIGPWLDKDFLFWVRAPAIGAPCAPAGAKKIIACTGTCTGGGLCNCWPCARGVKMVCKRGFWTVTGSRQTCK